MIPDTNRYRIADLVLETNLPIPDAAVALGPSAGMPECRFYWMGPQAITPKATGPFHRWTDASGKPFVWFYHREDGYQIRIRRTADFVVSAQADEIRCYAREKIPVETIRRLFLDVVLPMALSRRGRLTLHASAVATSSGAVGFLGGSGLGKSTLAAGLSKRGFPILCDDSMVLKQDGDRMVVVPTDAGVRLWPDSVAALMDNQSGNIHSAGYTEKKRFIRGESATATLPLVRLYMLAPSKAREVGTSIWIEKFSPADALVDLIRCSHSLDVTDKNMIRTKLDELTALSKQIPCFRLIFPHDYSRLEDLYKAVMQV